MTNDFLDVVCKCGFSYCKLSEGAKSEPCPQCDRIYEARVNPETGKLKAYEIIIKKAKRKKK